MGKSVLEWVDRRFAPTHQWLGLWWNQELQLALLERQNATWKVVDIHKAPAAGVDTLFDSLPALARQARMIVDMECVVVPLDSDASSAPESLGPVNAEDLVFVERHSLPAGAAWCRVDAINRLREQHPWIRHCASLHLLALLKPKTESDLSIVWLEGLPYGRLWVGTEEVVQESIRVRAVHTPVLNLDDLEPAVRPWVALDHPAWEQANLEVVAPETFATQAFLSLASSPDESVLQHSTPDPWLERQRFSWWKGRLVAAAVVVLLLELLWTGQLLGRGVWHAWTVHQSRSTQPDLARMEVHWTGLQGELRRMVPRWRQFTADPPLRHLAFAHASERMPADIQLGAWEYSNAPNEGKHNLEGTSTDPQAVSNWMRQLEKDSLWSSVRLRFTESVVGEGTRFGIELTERRP